MSGLLSCLFQPNKGHLSPAGRAFVSWLEIVILGILASAAAVGLNYINGNPGDYQGLLKIIVASLVISVLKAFSGLSIPRAATPSPFAPTMQPVQQAPVAPQAQQAAQSVQVPQVQFTAPTASAPQAPQFVQTAPQPPFAFAPSTTYPTVPTVPGQ